MRYNLFQKSFKAADIKHKLCKIYNDDVMLIIDQKQLKALLNYINGKLTKLKFSVEIEEYKKYFLDLPIVRMNNIHE